MTFSGITAVQARIQEIEAQVGLSKPDAAATGTSSTTSGSGSDFASALSDAMSTQGALGASGLTGDASATGTGTTTSPDISSLISSLTGNGGTTGTGSTTSSSPDISSLISSLTGSAGSTTGGGATAAAPNATTQQFIETALAQAGKPYVWGATASTTDPNPPAFDCSELTKWAAARSNVTIPDGAAHQYVWLKEHGATMSVQQALQTPGALLFSFNGEPQPGLAGEPAHAHVAISLGNGKTIEAKGHAYGVGVFDAANRFNYAGMIPGMN
jgi:cell wall-associated NlpC family hydrolase